MLRYRLLKDLPTFKARDMFYISQYGALIYDDGGFGVMVYSQSTLKRFPNILTDWFEEIQEEPTDSIRWKPKNGDNYFYIVHSYVLLGAIAILILVAVVALIAAIIKVLIEICAQ